ncbi:PREDICTED: retbindin [Thamnophis sirtalis]|uniref:Retbindin n=1 Tax=Thamnophis sirtalis TaxID=35019 RepID=A0A6I9XVC5_9SAUR|nr:PREDICTED: retbindin [Thamnophis sirtalis]
MRGGGNTNWIMVMASALTMFWVNAKDTEDHCLSGGKHKANPSAEEELGICQMYAENACCSPEVAQELSRASAGSWNRCGSLSIRCEEYLRQLDCFYHCSPIAAQWPHHQQPTALMAVPLCQNFCDQWYDACREDVTCPGNWPWGADGHNCSQECHSFGQMYKDGKELCENIWDDAFIVSADPCQCLMLDASDAAFSTSYSHLKESNSVKEVDVNKAGKERKDRVSPCRGNLLLQRLRRNLQKRFIFIEDMEGSGSGF